MVINWICGTEPMSSGGNTSSNLQVLSFIPRPACNGMEKMYQGHGSNYSPSCSSPKTNHIINLYIAAYAVEEFVFQMSSRGISRLDSDQRYEKRMRNGCIGFFTTCHNSFMFVMLAITPAKQQVLNVCFVLNLVVLNSWSNLLICTPTEMITMIHEISKCMWDGQEKCIIFTHVTKWYQ